MTTSPFEQLIDRVMDRVSDTYEGRVSLDDAHRLVMIISEMQAVAQKHLEDFHRSDDYGSCNMCGYDFGKSIEAMNKRINDIAKGEG